MKALSIWPEYVSEILNGEKNIEYRSWHTKHRGDLLICSTARKTKGCISGHALLVCRIEDISYSNYHNCYEWHLSELRLIKPFPVKGKQGLFNVDDNLIEIIDYTDKNFKKYYFPLIDK